MPQPTIELLTSEANALLKDVRKAVSRGTLTSAGCAVAEGIHLLDEALRTSCEIQSVIAAEPARAALESRLPRLNGATRVAVLTTALFSTLATTESSQGVIALVRPPAWSLAALLPGGAPPLVVILDGIQDPGNAGAILRAAEAFSATGAVFLRGSVSPYNPKALRASAGSAFRLPLVSGAEPEPVLAALKQNRVEMFAATPRHPAALLPQDAPLASASALAIGSEGRGLDPRLAAAARPITIPTAGVESLNAAMAAGILLYEAARQRRSAGA